MPTNHVVIGAGFGDEGKGLMTDYIASQSGDPIVVRYGSSGQCTHTVVTPKGKRHIFKHIGAGALVGAPTYYSEHVVVHPMVFREEYEELGAKGVYAPIVYVNPQCKVTTPFDMMINQIAERIRSGRHGSCGFGFGETIQRNLLSDFRMTIGQCAEHFDDLFDILDNFRDTYVQERLAWMGINKAPEPFDELLYDDGIIHAWIKDIEFFLDKTDFKGSMVLRRYEDVIFEGAQGLALSQDSGFFPHVTRSFTGLDNVLDIINRNGYLANNALKVNYMTRAYLNKHGAGELPGEDPNLQYEDDTNGSNEWQGAPRYAPLNYILLKELVLEDQKKAPRGTEFAVNITHMDQVPEFVKLANVNPAGLPIHLNKHGLEVMMRNGLNATRTYFTYGPTREDVKLYV